MKGGKMRKKVNRISGKGLFLFTLSGGLLLLFAGRATAQSAHKLLRKGNQLYEQQHYADAEASYKKALMKDSVSTTGLFNLGNTLYHQQRYEEAAARYAQSLEAEKHSAREVASSQYNIGNTFMQKKQWEKAIEAYKKSLLIAPEDDQARYNLAYAKAMLKKKEGGGGKNDKNKKNQQNNKQDQKKQQQKKDQNQQKDQDKQPQDQQKNKNQPKPRPGEMDKQRANQLLNAVAQQEKKIREDKDKKEKGVQVYNGKQW